MAKCYVSSWAATISNEYPLTTVEEHLHSRRQSVDPYLDRRKCPFIQDIVGFQVIIMSPCYGTNKGRE